MSFTHLQKVITRRLLFILAAMCLCACAQIHTKTHSIATSYLRAQQPEAALETLEAQSKSAKKSVLFKLDKAMILREMGLYEQSTQEFERAKKIIGELSPISISETLSSYSVSEQFNSYKATIYEKLFVHVYQIMNFLAINDLAGARVEALQIDLALNRLSEVGHHKEAAAVRYISGLIFESSKELDTAFINYQRSQDNYTQANTSPPKDLQMRLLRLSQHLNFEQKHQEFTQLFEPQKLKDARQEPHGELILFLGIDFIPQKTEVSGTIVEPNSGHIFRLSLPHLEPQDLGNIHARITAKNMSFNSKPFSSETLSDIEAIAIDDLEKQIPKLKRRAISRNITKYKLSSQANKESEILGSLISIIGAALEQADTRSWMTLPNKIHIATQTLPPGTYTLNVSLVNDNNVEVGHTTINNIEITKDQFTFINHHWYQPLQINSN